MTNYKNGHYAETVAAEWLKHQGFNIIAVNWRTRRCEIDVVAEKDSCVFFVEVKYRQTHSQGNGLDYVTTSKLRQMRFAAAMWLSENDWLGDVSLAALEISGPKFEVTAFVADCGPN